MRRILRFALFGVLSLAIAASAQSLSGVWETTLIINPQEAALSDFLDFTTDLTMDYEVGGWVVTSVSKLDDSGWTDQTFAAVGSFGAWAINANLVLDPAGAFDTLLVASGMTFGSVELSFVTLLQDMELRLLVSGESSTDLLDIAASMVFGTPGNDVCDLDWQGFDFGASFAFCCADVEAAIWLPSSTDLILAVSAEGITLPDLPWLAFDAILILQPDEKRLRIDPTFNFGEFEACIEVYATQESKSADAPDAPLVLGDIIIDGISISCEVGGITFTGTSFWGDAACRFVPDEDHPCDFPNILSGKEKEYWQAYQIATTDDACCGPFAFDATVFFDDEGDSLFDVALFEVNMTYDLGEPFTCGIGLDHDPATGLTEWRIDFVVDW